MNDSLRSKTLLILASAVLGGCATCGPGTIESDGGGWRFDRDDGFFSGFQNNFNKVCLPVGTISDCTDYQMIEEDGGGWRSDRDGGGWRSDRDGGGWRIDRDGGGWRFDRDGGGWLRERDEPHHPGDAGDPPQPIFYVPTGVCRIGVPPPA
ncbi:MAG: hypothetical protein KJO98_06480 [Rhodothermia bacterium]|nr:hypothetical protein [Rhodothermia bacterium]